MTKRRALYVGLLSLLALSLVVAAQFASRPESEISAAAATSAAVAHLATMRPGQSYVVVETFRAPDEDDLSLDGGKLRFSSSQSVSLLGLRIELPRWFRHARPAWVIHASSPDSEAYVVIDAQLGTVKSASIVQLFR